ncbi:MAG TPA: flagellar hook protein FlgE [Terriglobales bacterium]|nr:flagellar hook protein FlgE [Terriglobales bacterium]
MPVFSIPLSGLNASSTALATIANNLANLNTVGFKRAQAMFKDLFYQTIGSSGSGDPIQVGAGTTVSKMNTNFTPGSTDSTGVDTDVAIGGDGFFVVEKDGVMSYTRAGNFSKSPDGTLVTADGKQVLGFPAVNGVISQTQGLSPLQLGTGTVSPPNATTTANLTLNLDSRLGIGESYSTPLTVYDSLGESHVLQFQFTKTAANTWGYQITIPGADVGAATPQVVHAGSLTFDNAGNLTAPAVDVAGIAIAGLADGAANITFNWQLYQGGAGTITQVASPSSPSSTSQDGFGAGSLQSFTIGSDGLIQGTFSNEKTAILGQLALANFANPQGLLRSGGNNFTATLASGAAAIGAPGTGGRGALTGGALELSNVDIATEFASLIQAQRAFQANARTITTFDEITQDTINLKR